MKTTEGRWKRAQKYELEFWKRNEDLLPERGGKPPKHLDFVEEGEALVGRRGSEVEDPGDLIFDGRTVGEDEPGDVTRGHTGTRAEIGPDEDLAAIE